jgi:hypothetical protein
MLAPKVRLIGVITEADPVRGHWFARSKRCGTVWIEIGEVGTESMMQHQTLPHMTVGAIVEFDYQQDSDGTDWVTNVEVCEVAQ